MPHTPPTQLQGITSLTVIADVKPGLIDGIFDSRSYTWRLRQVLALLDTARRASREAEAEPSLLADSVARLRGIHSFSFTLLPAAEDRPPPDRLLLNVIFDGGWEPYMRLIWGPLGSLLDLIFCHCDTYPLARESSFEDYIGWVRQHEQPAQFFYMDSPGTVADRVFLNRLETLQRTRGGEKDFAADLEAAKATLNAAAPASQDALPQQRQQKVAAASLRRLKGLYGLLPWFGPPVSPSTGETLQDGTVLLRFARDFLPELCELVDQEAGVRQENQLAMEALQPRFEQELAWFTAGSRLAQTESQDRPAPRRNEVQAGILDPLRAPAGRYTRGALALVRVTDPARARAWLRTAAGAGTSAPRVTSGHRTRLEPGEVSCTVAVTFSGLRQLGVPESELSLLPGEFIQGMEARAGILGDLRDNHPQRWSRPSPAVADTDPAVPIDLSLVHLVIQLRACEADKDTERSSLSAQLDGWIGDHLSPKVEPPTGLELLAVEPTWSRPHEEPAPRDHFGFADGISQPSLLPPPDSDGQASQARMPPATDTRYWSNETPLGEVLLGWANDHGDQAWSESPARWTDQGTFLVVRKIRQFASRFDECVEKAAAQLMSGEVVSEPDQARELVRAKLMGRHSDGKPLVQPWGPGINDFDYHDDREGLQCPFASHVRRANPRSELPGARPPRIVRRGMSYGPETEEASDQARGVVFMAYNASIAEQFEVIQRWLTGGNSSGVCSTHTDPLLGVPQAGEDHIFRFCHGDRVHRVNLGSQPLSQLDWGLYAFVPSMRRLREWPEPRRQQASTVQPASGEREPPEPPAADADKRKAQEAKAKMLFEDDERRGQQWGALLQRNDGIRQIGETVVVGAYAQVLEVLRDTGAAFSAGDYGVRMNDTLGPSPFGQDHSHGKAHGAQALVPAIKDAIEAAVKEEAAYRTAYDWTRNRIEQLWQATQAGTPPIASIEVVPLGTGLIETLCQDWFGVAYADGSRAAPSDPAAVEVQRGGMAAQAQPVRCPGHFLPVARNIFSALPNDTVKAMAKTHGEALKEWVAKFVEANRHNADAPILQAVLKVLQGSGLTPAEEQGIVANVMLGLPPTLLGSWGKVVRNWTVNRTLWQLQHDLLLSGEGGDHGRARAVLMGPLLSAMAADPVADGIWRTVADKEKVLGQIPLEHVKFVWLGLGSAIKQAAQATAPDKLHELYSDLLFGGVWEGKSGQAASDPKSSYALPEPSPHATPHACPGRHMALGALLGAAEALLRSGSLAASASPVILELSRP